MAVVNRYIFADLNIDFIKKKETICFSYFSSSTSGKLRRWSGPQLTVRTIIVTGIFLSILFIHVAFDYTIVYPKHSCYFPSQFHQDLFSMMNLIFYSWLPSFGILLFGLLTVRNIHQSKIRIATEINQQQQHQKKMNQQLIQMVLGQSFIFGSTSMAYAITHLYVSIKTNFNQSDSLGGEKYNSITTIGSWLSITGPCLSFYLFTSTSQLFRRELFYLFKKRTSYSNSVLQ